MQPRSGRGPKSIQTVIILVVAVATLQLAAATGRSGGGPENVAVVVNASSWASLAVANTFIQLRDIPANNIIYLNDIERFEQMDVETFRHKILSPVLDTLAQRDILQQIDCIAYSSDLPTAIAVNRDVGDKQLSKVLTQTASINGLTYLYERVLKEDPDYLQLNTNRYMRYPVRRATIVRMRTEDQAAHDETSDLMAQQQWEKAAEALGTLAQRYLANPEIQYNYACCLARLGKTDLALQALEHAARAGWIDARHTRQDDDLASLRDSDRFRKLLEQMTRASQTEFDVQPTMGFRSQYAWNGTGQNTPVSGEHYMLSIVLAVTSGRGNSISEAIRCLQRGAAADGTRPKGTIYYMVNSNVRSTTRKNAFPSAIKALSKLGVRAEQVEGTLPQGKDDVAGVMIGTATFHWSASGSTILPGAICEHLTSLGGVMREGGGQTPLSELIRYGATGASGTVTEPYAIQAKFPFPFIHVHYARGCSLAEAFYQSVSGPYQLLIVGDPLCQPWAQRLDVSVDGIKPNQRITGSITLQPRARLGDGSDGAVDHYELFVDGKRHSYCDPHASLELDTTPLVDGRHGLTVVAVAAGAIEVQSRCTVPVVVDNHADAVTLDLDAGQRLDWGGTLVVRASSHDAAAIAILHNARRVGIIQGATGAVEIPAALLGIGTVRLRAVAQIEDRFALSEPRSVTILPPPVLRSSSPPDQGHLADGFRVEPEGGKAIVVSDTKDGQWLKNAGVTPRQRFTLDGWIAVPADDLYQFQFRGNGLIVVTVDDQPVWTGSPLGGSSATWQMLPVHLAGGLHHVQFRGIGTKTPRLEIRFGGSGCLRLDGKRWRHVEP